MTEPFPKRRLLRSGVMLSVGAALIAAAYGAYWMVLAGNVRSAAETWIAARRAEGILIGYARIETGGFPGAVRLTFIEPAVVAGGGWRWSGPRAEARVNPVRPGRPVIRLIGEQQLEIVTARRRLHLRGAAGELAVVGEVSNGRLEGGTLSVRALTIRGPRPLFGGKPLVVGRLDVSLRRLSVIAADRVPPSLTVAVAAADIILPKTAATPLSPAVETLTVQAVVHGRIDGPPWCEAVRRWVDAGGFVKIGRLALTYGPTSLEGEGKVAFDAARRPAVVLIARIAGAFQLIDRLRAAGLIRRGDAVGAKVALALLAREPEDGGAPVVPVQLTMRDDRVFAGPLRLFRWPPIRWPCLGAEDTARG